MRHVAGGEGGEGDLRYRTPQFDTQSLSGKELELVLWRQDCTVPIVYLVATNLISHPIIF